MRYSRAVARNRIVTPSAARGKRARTAPYLSDCAGSASCSMATALRLSLMH
jgi:hypothetical protein